MTKPSKREEVTRVPPLTTSPFWTRADRLVPSAVLLVWVAAVVAVWDMPLRLDEWGHSDLVHDFARGSYEVYPWITTLPGYNLLMSVPVRVFDLEGPGSLRLINSLFGLAAIFAFLPCVRRVNPEVAGERTLQLALLPILFPFNFLIYTEALALLLLLVGAWGYLDRKPTLSAAALILGCLVRQTGVVWLAAFFGMFYLREHGLSLGAAAIRQHLREQWLFLVGFAASAVFVVVNGGVAIGDRDMHPAFGFHDDNVVAFLIYFAILFLPTFVGQLPAMLRFARERFFLAAGLVALVGLFLLGAESDHPWNQGKLGWLLRARFLAVLRWSDMLQAAVAAMCVASAFSLAVTRLREAPAYLVYPVAVFILTSHWLIEARYYIPIVALLLLFKLPENRWVERLTPVWFLGLSGWLMLQIVSGEGFP